MALFGGVSVIKRRLAALMRRRRVRLIILAALAAVGALIVVLAYSSLFQSDKPHKHHGSHGSSAHKKSEPDKKKTESQAAAPASSGDTGSSSSPPPAAAGYPANVLNLTNWKLTLPIGSKGDPQEITQPRLNQFALSPYFRVNAQKNGVVFQAPAGGVTTENSSYPRSELREMTAGGSREASWSDTSGTHVMTIRQAITHLPSAKPEVVAGQIHDDDGYVILIRLEGSRLFVEGDDENVGTLDSNYRLGTIFTVRVVAAGGHIKVFYNGAQKVDYARSGSQYYFKAGCYTQSNPSKGDSPSAYGQVIIYSLSVSHS
jgi:poly(beta-D-mannuronate) lyase